MYGGTHPQNDIVLKHHPDDPLDRKKRKEKLHPLIYKTSLSFRGSVCVTSDQAPCNELVVDSMAQWIPVRLIRASLVAFRR